MFSYELYRILGIGKQVFYARYAIIPVSLTASIAAVIILLGFGVYKKESSLLNVEEIKNVVKGISLSYLIFMLILVFGRFQLSRYVLVFSYFLSIAFVVIEKTMLYHLIPMTKVIKGFNKRVLILGAGTLGEALFRSITNSPKLGIDPVGFVDDDPDKIGTVIRSSSFNGTLSSLAVLGTIEDIPGLMTRHEVDEVYLAISNIEQDKLIEILGRLKEKNIRTSFVPNLYNVFFHKVNIQQIGQIPIITEEAEKRNTYSPLKRCTDFFLAVVSLVFFFPVFLAVACAIKIDSKGPVYFRQQRVGKDGKIFSIYKFRTMSTDSDPYAINPVNVNDPRISRVGRFLRKTSLDELPQIINVLKGDMSFIGPRPEMPFIVEQYNEMHRERLKVPPGITGLWQLSGDRERAIHENMDYDLYYLKNRSFFLDWAILMETLIFAFRGI